MVLRFDHIISLGSDCDVALQLRRRGWLHTPSVFDWLITPWDAMMLVLAEEGARLATRFTSSHGGKGVACAEYGLVYWHEFPRGNDGFPIVSPDQCKATLDKLHHKLARMRAACQPGDCVLFIRSGVITDAPGDRFAAGTPFSGVELDRCARLIETRYPSLKFSILTILYDGLDSLASPGPTDARVTLCTMRRSGAPTAGHTTKASDADWDAILSQIPYNGTADAEQLPEILSY